jgi:hypothetical protein
MMKTVLNPSTNATEWENVCHRFTVIICVLLRVRSIRDAP